MRRSLAAILTQLYARYVRHFTEAAETSSYSIEIEGSHIIMRRFYPDNLTPEDRRTYRRWTQSLYFFYFVTIAIAVALSSLGRQKTDLVASANHVQRGSAQSMPTKLPPPK